MSVFRETDLTTLAGRVGSNPLPPGVGSLWITIYEDPFKIPRLNVGGLMYNKTMKKRTKPINNVNEATRKAHSAELFKSLLLTKHTVVVPEHRKGTRQSNIRKAINESL
jgi:hypothetical protein